MKAPGDRKKQGTQHHPEKYLDKYGSSSKSKHSQPYKDKRQPAVETGNPQKANDEALPSQHLWIGNVSISVTKTMLAEQFSRFGDIESIKLFSQKNYAFVILKTVEDAVYAKKGLNGSVIGGLALRIEFVRGAQDVKPRNHEEGDKKRLNGEKQAEEKIIHQEKGQKDFLQEKKGMLTKMAPLEDNSRHASNVSKEDNSRHASYVSKEDNSRHASNVSKEDNSRHASYVSKGNKNGDPSEVLWIGFPLHLNIDEKKLHKLFAPFGGVEKITSFPGRTYAFVRFQNIKAASRAKDALQGKLFDDPRVSISFAKSEVGPVDHFQGSSELQPPPSKAAAARALLSTSVKGEEETSNSSAKIELDSGKYSNASPKTNLLVASTPLPYFVPSTSQSELTQENQDSYWSASHLLPSKPGTDLNVAGQSMEPKCNIDMQIEISGNAFSKHILKSDLGKGMQVVSNDEISVSKGSKSDGSRMCEDTDIRNQKRGRSEMENTPKGAPFSSGMTSTIFETLNTQGDDGEFKRQRIENEQSWAESSNLRDNVNQTGGNLSRETWDDRNMGNAGLGGRTPVGNSKQGESNAHLKSEENLETKEGSSNGLVGEIPSASLNIEQQPLGSQTEHGLVESPISPARTDGGSPICLSPKDVFRWEGTIAKGGTEVCHCRCFPATKEINIIFPDSLNCTARTSLDMLAQYISQVREFSVVLFMPQGVPDVAPYQELMAFLANKKRAAVCELSDENTLFLVPPSDFVEQFLNVPKSNNILGVILGQQQQQQQSQPSQTFTDHTISRRTSDSKANNTKDQGEFPVCPSTDIQPMKTSLSLQHIAYPHESSNPGVSNPFQDMFGTNLLGPDMLQEHDVVINSGISYGAQGNKVLMREYQAHESNLLPDTRNIPLQIPGSTPMPIPMPHCLHMLSSASLSGSIIPAHQDPIMLSRPLLFPSPRTPELIPVSGSNQKINDIQKPSASFAFPERPWSIPGTPHSVITTQMNHRIPKLQQTFSYGSTPQQTFPAFDSQGQDGPLQSSNFAFGLSGTSIRNINPPPLVSEASSRPPGLPLEFSMHRSVPPMVARQGSVSQDQEKQGAETDQQQALHVALTRMQNPDSSEEEQRKFRATVELAAALLQQLQQQTKL